MFDRFPIRVEVDQVVLIILFLFDQVAELQVEIDHLRIKHAGVLKETKRLQEGKHAEAEKVISALYEHHTHLRLLKKTNNVH